MTSKQEQLKADVPTTGNPPYPFRFGWALLLLAGNLLVAAFYFGILK
ncbi:MAG: photosystem I protein PsaX [Elainellaceae cyanobacterium]